MNSQLSYSLKLPLSSKETEDESSDNTDRMSNFTQLQRHSIGTHITDI